MSHVWELQFTTQFEKDVKKLKKSGNSAWLDGLNVLKKGVQFNNNLKQLKGRSKGFRWRNGDIRVIFRILGNTREILLMSAGYRKDVYKKKISEDSQRIKIFDPLLKHQRKIELPVIETTTQKMLVRDVADDSPNKIITNTENCFIEEVFIDIADLYLLNIDDRYYEELLESQSIDLARNNGIPEDICNLIEDYLTTPSAHHIGKIYTLEHLDNIECIAQQPLSSFLVKLDPQQKQIVNKPLGKSALLIRGGPGTGKTLIHLARIKRIIEEEVETGLSSNKVKIGFVSYNKILSQTASSMFKEIISENSQNSVEPEFKTFDSIIFQLGQQIQSTSATIICEREQKEALGFVINSCTDNDLDKHYLMDVSSRRGLGYILEEFEQVLLGNDLLNIDSYLSFARKCRKIRLLEKERKLIFCNRSPTP